MNYRSYAAFCLFASMVSVFAGCKQSSSPSSGGGFAVSVVEETQSVTGSVSPPRPIPFAPVTGYYDEPVPNETASGTVQSYDGSEGTDATQAGIPAEYDQSSNYYWVSYGVAPAYWTHSFTLNYECGTENLIYTNGSEWTYQLLGVETFLTSGAQDVCLTYYLPPASTRFAILGQLPQTLTLSGNAPFITTYGMPTLYVYDGTLTLVSTESATSVSSDGSQATFPFPSSLQQNGYSVAVANKTNSSPGISTVGTNYLSIAKSATIAGNPFGIAVAGQTHSYEDLDTCDKPDTTSGSYYSTFPIVSLYSKNQVLIGNTPVGVGTNPTAVAAYSFPALGTTTTEGCFTYINGYSGSTRAIVANSGANTVSILDIVNDVLLSNITVGNQPVALAVTSNGSEAYVANYKDSTVTQINLSTRAVTATVAVGGKPTSVALTAAGTLWVGGVGFLTEINTSSMSVVATETVNGKTIVALGYSDSVSQLVATSVDGSGNVYVDEINPANVTAGGTYTVLASNVVSSLGTHLDQATDAEVQSFTSTLASASLINTNQVGAPPLVVQDGWAVITATPTGFTITDITGHDVLISETTPSPITAIAVDPNLNVAYLAMPDSNILLTVPLPGTN
jgi:YVTN family beta-propeller protein